MKYRALDGAGDYQFGRTGLLLTDTPQVVAQAVLTRLRLWTGQWFLDADEGTPYMDGILGYGTQDTRDILTRARILGTPGVTEITRYSSSVQGRSMLVTAEIQTQYGTATINSTTETTR